MALDNPILAAALNHISLEQIKAEKGPPPWSHQVGVALPGHGHLHVKPEHKAEVTIE